MIIYNYRKINNTLLKERKKVMKILVIDIHLTNGTTVKETIYGIYPAIDRAIEIMVCDNVEFLDVWDIQTGEIYLTAKEKIFTYVADDLFDLLVKEK